MLIDNESKIKILSEEMVEVISYLMENWIWFIYLYELNKRFRKNLRKMFYLSIDAVNTYNYSQNSENIIGNLTIGFWTI